MRNLERDPSVKKELEIISIHDAGLTCVSMHIQGRNSFPLILFQVVEDTLRTYADRHSDCHDGNNFYIYKNWHISIRSSRINGNAIYFVYVNFLSRAGDISISANPDNGLDNFAELASLINKRVSHRILNIFTPLSVYLYSLPGGEDRIETGRPAFLKREIDRGKAYLHLYNDFYREAGSIPDKSRVVTVTSCLESITKTFSRLSPEMAGWFHFSSDETDRYIYVDTNRFAMALFPLFEKILYETVPFKGIRINWKVEQQLVIMHFPLFHLNDRRDPDFILAVSMAKSHLKDAGATLRLAGNMCELVMPVYSAEKADSLITARAE